MNPMLNIAIRAARKAGNIVAKGFERRDEIETREKSANDYVTNIDRASEAAIIDIIQPTPLLAKKAVRWKAITKCNGLLIRWMEPLTL